MINKYKYYNSRQNNTLLQKIRYLKLEKLNLFYLREKLNLFYGA